MKFSGGRGNPKDKGEIIIMHKKGIYRRLSMETNMHQSTSQQEEGKASRKKKQMGVSLCFNSYLIPFLTRPVDTMKSIVEER